MVVRAYVFNDLRELALALVSLAVAETASARTRNDTLARMLSLQLLPGSLPSRRFEAAGSLEPLGCPHLSHTQRRCRSTTASLLAGLGPANALTAFGLLPAVGGRMTEIPDRTPTRCRDSGN